LGAAHQEVQHPVAQGGVQNEHHCYVGIPLVQTGQGSVQCDGDGIVCGQSPTL
jgi:hypothetical protein